MVEEFQKVIELVAATEKDFTAEKEKLLGHRSFRALFQDDIAFSYGSAGLPELGMSTHPTIDALLDKTGIKNTVELGTRPPGHAGMDCHAL
jgi:hypothetical protein